MDSQRHRSIPVNYLESKGMIPGRKLIGSWKVVGTRSVLFARVWIVSHQTMLCKDDKECCSTNPGEISGHAQGITFPIKKAVIPRDWTWSEHETNVLEYFERRLKETDEIA